MSFSFERKLTSNVSFLGVEVSQQQGKFVTTVYKKPTFSSVHTHFDSFCQRYTKLLSYTL